MVTRFNYNRLGMSHFQGKYPNFCPFDLENYDQSNVFKSIPKRDFEEAVPEGPATGEIISREEFDRMLDEYYQLHGWDENGIPKKGTLKRLGIDWRG